MPDRPLGRLAGQTTETAAHVSRGSIARIVHLTLRWVLGVTLLTTSLGKALDVPGFRDVLRNYDLFPISSLWLIAFAMPVIEAGIAFTMLTGRWLRAGIVASGLLHASFAAILTLELLRGIDLQNCGCFGVFLARPLTWYTPLEDVLLLAVTLGIAATIDRGRRHTAFAGAA